MLFIYGVNEATGSKYGYQPLDRAFIITAKGRTFVNTTLHVNDVMTIFRDMSAKKFLELCTRDSIDLNELIITRLSKECVYVDHNINLKLSKINSPIVYMREGIYNKSIAGQTVILVKSSLEKENVSAMIQKCCEKPKSYQERIDDAVKANIERLIKNGKRRFGTYPDEKAATTFKDSLSRYINNLSVVKTSEGYVVEC